MAPLIESGHFVNWKLADHKNTYTQSHLWRQARCLKIYYTTPEFPAWNSIGMLRPRSIKSLTLEGIFKLCKQWFRRLTSGHNYVFLRLLLRVTFRNNHSQPSCHSKLPLFPIQKSLTWNFSLITFIHSSPSCEVRLWLSLYRGTSHPLSLYLPFSPPSLYLFYHVW